MAYTSLWCVTLLIRNLSCLPFAYALPSLAVTSVLAIGGIGGLAIGLAGREICENLLNGFLIMSTVRLSISLDN